MNSRVFIFSKRELTIIVLGTVLGGVLQVICYKYLQNHPESFNDENSKKIEPVNETKKPGLRRFFPRGGALIEIIGGVKIVINVASLITYIAQKGTLVGVILTTTGVIVKKIPATAVSTIVRNALPTTHSGLGKGFIIVDGQKIVLDQCDQTLTYLFTMLSSEDIPFNVKKEMSFKILMEHLSLSTPSGRVRFLICIISMLHVFAIADISCYFIMMQNLIKAVKNGKISKQLARMIIRRLLRLKLDVDPEFIKAAG